MKPARLSDEAIDELAEALAWYRQQRAGLEIEFTEEVNRLLPRIGDAPATFARVQGLPDDLPIRRAFLRRFPYALVFIELDHEVRIVAAAHAKRRPNYWLDRIRA